MNTDTQANKEKHLNFRIISALRAASMLRSNPFMPTVEPLALQLLNSFLAKTYNADTIKILRLARAIAALEEPLTLKDGVVNTQTLKLPHIAEALQYVHLVNW